MIRLKEPRKHAIFLEQDDTLIKLSRIVLLKEKKKDHLWFQYKLFSTNKINCLSKILFHYFVSIENHVITNIIKEISSIKTIENSLIFISISE